MRPDSTAGRRSGTQVHARLATIVVVLSLFGALWNIVDNQDIPASVGGISAAEDASLRALIERSTRSTSERYLLYAALREVGVGGVVVVGDPGLAAVLGDQELRWLARVDLEERPAEVDLSAEAEPLHTVAGVVRPATGGEPVPFGILAGEGPAAEFVLVDDGGTLLFVDTRLLP